MSREEFIQDLTARLKKETDQGVLQAINTLLAKDTKAARIKRHMMETAILSEQDIKEGRLHSWEEVKGEIQEMLNERRKKSGSKRA